MHEQPIDPQYSPDAGEEPARQAALIARRRLLRGSVGVAPVLLVSAPRSVMAQGVTCLTASSSVSLNPSGGAQASVQTCSGRLPEYWSTCALTEWPGTCLKNTAQTKLFSEIIGAPGAMAQNTTLKGVLLLPGNELAKLVVAAVLNARKGFTPAVILSESTAKEIWSKCSTGSYFEPTAGIKWYANSSQPTSSGGCIQWLKSTMS